MTVAFLYSRLLFGGTVGNLKLSLHLFLFAKNGLSGYTIQSVQSKVSTRARRPIKEGVCVGRTAYNLVW